MSEEWRPIPGYEGRYEASDQGRVRSLWFKNGTADKPRATPHVLRLTPSGTGHLRVLLGRGNDQAVHRLVLAAFAGPCPPGQECAHANGDPADNRLVNLRWCTHVENLRDMVAHGRRLTGDRNPARLHPERVPRGEAVGHAKLTSSAVRRIRTAALRGATQASLSRRYGVKPPTIRDVLTGRTWRHVRG